MNLILRSASVLALVASALAASAQNLVANGSFENSSGGTIANWIVTPPASSSNQAAYPTATGTSPYGSRFLVLDPGVSGVTGSATQDFAILPTVGQTYTVSFAYKQIGGTAGIPSLLVTINSTSLPLTPTAFAATPSNDFSVWQRGSFTFVGDGFLKGITFANPASTGLATSDLLVDDVSVQAVPEPTSLAVFGLPALALLRRRKRA